MAALRRAKENLHPGVGAKNFSTKNFLATHTVKLRFTPTRKTEAGETNRLLRHFGADTQRVPLRSPMLRKPHEREQLNSHACRLRGLVHINPVRPRLATVGCVAAGQMHNMAIRWLQTRGDRDVLHRNARMA